MGFLPTFIRVMSSLSGCHTSHWYSTPAVLGHTVAVVLSMLARARHRDGRRRTGWHHYPSTLHLQYRSARHWAFPGSLQQPSPLCRTPALGWEPCLFLLCEVHTGTLCLAKCHAQSWLSCHTWPAVLHMGAQRPTRCTMADQYPASHQCSTFIPHYPHFSANTNISGSLDQ